MAHLDACRFFPTAGGTTDWTYSTTVPGYQSPTLANAITGNLYSIRAESYDLTQWEIATGAFSGGVFARTTVLYNSSGSGTLQGGAGTKISFNTVPQVGVVPLAANFRELLTAHRTYYLSTTGLDTNSGRVTTLATITFTNGSANIGWPAHGQPVGANFFITTTGAVPTNFSIGPTTGITGIVYYVKTVVDANTITVSQTSGGAAVTAGSAGSGVHTANVVSSLLTLQKAYDKMCDGLDAQGFDPTIQFAFGTYTGGLATSKGLPGIASANNFRILGHSTPSNVVISTTGVDCIGIGNLLFGMSQFVIGGIKMQTTTAGNCINVSGGGSVIVFGTGPFPVEFGACAQSHIVGNHNCSLFAGIPGNIVSGSALVHGAALSGSTVAFHSNGETFVGAANSLAFIAGFWNAADNGTLYIDNMDATNVNTAAVSTANAWGLASDGGVIKNYPTNPTTPFANGAVAQIGGGRYLVTGTEPQILGDGGTGANLAATGGAGQYVKQAGAGAAFTVGTIPLADLPAMVVSVKKQTFTASGTYTPSTGMLYCIIECIGSGGGGGAANGATLATYVGGGGGAGGYSRLLATAATIGGSQTVTVSAAGTGGAAGTNNGTAGAGDVSVGTLCIAKPGAGGLFGSVGQQGAAGAGGVAGTGDVAAQGGPGQVGFYNSTNATIVLSSGGGGLSIFGGGGVPAAASTNGTAAGNYGGGGAGGNAYNVAANFAGGNGSKGIVVITEFCSQ